MGGRGDARAERAGVTRVAAVFLLAAIAVGAYAYAAEPTWYLRMRYPLRYEQIIRGHAENYRLEPTLLAAVIYQESKFDPDARSASGAIGLMQLLPETGQGIADRTGGESWQPDDLLDPELNVRYGSWYLRHLLDKYEGNVETALAAYNGGQGNVDRGVLYPETREYVARVTELQRIYERAYGPALAAG